MDAAVERIAAGGMRPVDVGQVYLGTLEQRSADAAPAFRYFLNEYYMCAILHYMSYDCVKCDPHRTMIQWLKYHR